MNERNLNLLRLSEIKFDVGRGFTSGVFRFNQVLSTITGINVRNLQCENMHATFGDGIDNIAAAMVDGYTSLGPLHFSNRLCFKSTLEFNCFANLPNLWLLQKLGRYP